MKYRIELVYFNAGGGHRAAAQALDAAIDQLALPWDVHLVNLAEMLDPKDRFRRLTGVAPEDFYNLRLARGWTLGLTQELKLLHVAIRLGHGSMVRILRRRWLLSRPDLVVSLIPNFNRALCIALAGARPHTPYVTVLTDLADYPPHFWIEPDIPQHVICGTARALEQARSLGRPASHIHAVSGMILHPHFYADLGPEERRHARAGLGLPPAEPVGMVMFGGHGAPAMLQIARALPDAPLLLICGHNGRLAERLRALPSRAPHVVLEYVTDMAHYMRLCDFFIGKPGPGAISEAVQQQLPVIIVRNALTMPQERFNAQWVREQGVGLVLRGVREVAPAVRELRDGLPAFRARTRQIHNRAVFQIPLILERILKEAQMQQPLSAQVTASG